MTSQFAAPGWADWNGGDYTAAKDETIAGPVNVPDDAILILNKDVTLTVSAGITIAGGKTLTIKGPGTLDVKGSNGADGSRGSNGADGADGSDGTIGAVGGRGSDGASGDIGSPAIKGTVIIEGATVNATGGNGGKGGLGGDGGKGGKGSRSGSGTVGHGGTGGDSGNGGDGGAAFEGSVTINGGTVTGTGGSGGDGGDGGNGRGDSGQMGSAGDGGDGGNGGNGGNGGTAFAASVTIDGGTVTGTGGGKGGGGGYGAGGDGGPEGGPDSESANDGSCGTAGSDGSTGIAFAEEPAKGNDDVSLNTSVNESETTIVATTPVRSVSLPASKDIPVGGAFTLTVTLVPDYASDKNVKWSVTEGEKYVGLCVEDGNALGADALSFDNPVTVKGLAAGTATVRVTASGKTADCQVTVKKGTPDYKVPTGLTATYGQTLADVKLSSGWTWNNSGTSVGNVGSHDFPATFTPGDTTNYNTVSADVTVRVNKAASAVTKAPTGKTGLTSNNRAQELITAGTATGGTMVYAVNGGAYNAAIPTGTEAGSYTVSYKVVGDANHNDTEEATLEVTIGQKPDDSGKTEDTGKTDGSGKTEEQKAIEEKAQEIVDKMDESVKQSEAGQTMTEALQSDDPETQEAAVEVVETLNKTLPTEAISDLSAHDIEKTVENKKEETADAKKEAQNDGKVENTTVPAGTDLLAKSDNEALNNASEKFTVSPKVVTPVAASPEETKELAQDLARVTSDDVPDGVDVSTVWAASANMNSSEDIEITPAPDDTAEQAKTLETLITKVIQALLQRRAVMASALPEMRAKKSGFFTLGINQRNLLPGQRPRFWPSVAHFNRTAGQANVADASVADADQEGDYFFLDENGKPTDVVSGDAAQMKLVAFLEGGKTYSDAFVTVDATSDDQAALTDLSTELTSTAAPSNNKGSGGCDGGFAGLAGMLAVVGLVAARKH